MDAAPDRISLLETIGSPSDLRRLPAAKLLDLATELRQFLIQSVSTRGGHFAAGFGTVELTIALHYVFNTPYDRLVWDVGHQAYPHKVLTGRREQLHTIKQDSGLAPFPTAQRERVRHLRRRPLQHLDQRRAGHGRSGCATRRESPGRCHHRRRRLDRGHGIRSAESRRLASRGSFDRAERQRHVDFRECRRAVELSGARTVRPHVLASARERQESSAADAHRLGACAPFGGAFEGHGAAGHAVRGDGFQLHRTHGRSRCKGAGQYAAQSAQASRAAVPARGDAQGKRLRAGGGGSHQVARPGAV